MTYIWGTKPTGYEVIDQAQAKDIKIEKGDIFGGTFEFDAKPAPSIRTWELLEREFAEIIIRKIRENGDEPLYVEVTVKPNLIWGIILKDVHVKVTFFAKKGNDPWLYLFILGLIAAILKAASDLIESWKNWKWVDFYIKHYGEVSPTPPAPPTPPENEKKSLALLLLIIIILYALSKRR